MLMLVFIGPMLLAVGAYYAPWEWVRESGAAHGDLIDPPRPLPLRSLTTASGTDTPEDWLRYRWSLIYASTAPCDTACLDELNRLNQVRLALGKDLARAQVILLFMGTAPILPAGADVTVARLDDGAGRVMLEVLGEENIRSGRIYIVDPLGRLAMTYEPMVEQKWLLEDLERLLQIV